MVPARVPWLFFEGCSRGFGRGHRRLTGKQCLQAGSGRFRLPNVNKGILAFVVLMCPKQPIKILLDRHNIGFFRKFLENPDFNGELIVTPIVWLADFEGQKPWLEKFEEFFAFLEKRGVSVKLFPVPPCVLKNGRFPVLEKLVKGAMPQGGWNMPSFLVEQGFVDYKPYNVIKPEGLSPLARCSACGLFGVSCHGIFCPVLTEKSASYFSPPVTSFIKSLKNPKILDVGSGFVGCTEEQAIKDSNCRVYCIDPSVSSIESLKDRVKNTPLENKIIPSLGLAEKIEFPDNYFDCILVKGSYAHIQGIESAFSELKRVLKEKGIIFVSENCNSPPAKPIAGISAEKKEKFFFFESQFLRHFRQHSLDDAKRIFKKSGFRVKTENTRGNGFSWVVVLEKRD